MKDYIKTNNKISLVDDIKIEPFDVNKRYTKPHRHSKYLEIIYFTKGEGFHHLDSKYHAIEPPMIFIVKKGEVHSWEINTIPKGYVIIFKETFLEKTRDRSINLQLNNIMITHKIKQQKKDASLKALFKILCREMEQPLPQMEFVEVILKALLGKIINYSHLNKTNDKADKITNFMELLIERPRNNCFLC